ncbi:TerD family protein [Yimella sp. cx-51]|uniref:TerD family protein n=1 Tax=Yimella sp. cx-51 TaxID=2770551 RepID=UPI00165EB4EB|nr:TerD family protein [Yimella sp. cx-51]MBC9957952.1 TerD family protein [Yimella sp. cx-51]QTH39712.1 TerD family protein [Yimella sp. cx-51]
MAKGANVALTREVPGLKGVVIGVDWDAGAERFLHDSLTLLTVLCGSNRKALTQDHVVHFNQMVSSDLSTAHVGQAKGDDDAQVEVDLAAVPQDVERIVFVLYVNEGGGGRRTLGQLRKLVVRVLNLDGGASLISTNDLVPGLSGETALSLVELYRHGGDWKLRVLGAGYSDGLKGVARDFGVHL